MALAFGIPALAMLNGAFTVKDPATGATSYTTANLTASLKGAYLTALLGSVKLSAVSAVISTVFGLLVAQAVVTSRFRALREAVLTASGVLANFGGVPLAFAFVATLGNSGVLTRYFGLADKGWNLYSFSGLVIVYLYFLIPLMVLTITPALDGLRVQWREAARNNGATSVQYWRHIALPVLAPSSSADSCCSSAAPSPRTPPPRPWWAVRSRWSPSRSPTPSPATSWSARRTWRSPSASTWSSSRAW